ncbi:phosphoesterase, PA-phosphatase related protein, precursor [Mycolicibacterium canariasense]|uniref:Phosphoesterase, PA-phosphatase related protein n=1 Tax=Mycolicibacterium canariasense TaxID=228230 RepID=A0A117IAG5_MYCCR|nr:phosphatase PAP2 family protein [Mycolicibacterium canariasense]GAS96330.1 phosphoesterase, PA-phosphatase related protein, precursor [Mycolicibacterium canariasense]
MTRRTRWATVLAIVSALVFVVLLVAVLTHAAWLATADAAILDPLHSYGLDHRGWVRGWKIFCDVFHPGVFRVVGAICIVVALFRRQFRVALFLTLSVEASGLLVAALKIAVRRPRPSFDLAYEPSWSFPSGHALGVMTGVLALTIVAVQMLPGAAHHSWRTPVIVAGAVIVLGIGVGRVVLNVHNPSDVLAGWALGYLWVLACLPVLSRESIRPAAGTPAAHGSAP